MLLYMATRYHTCDTCDIAFFLHNVIGYEPAGLTVHPPQNDRGWVHFFRIGV